jgi:hypothetical protein
MASTVVSSAGRTTPRTRRQCAGETGPKAVRVQCSIWPLTSSAFCAVHDPVAKAERQAEKDSLTYQLTRLRQRVTPAVGVKVVELLLLRRKVTVGDVVAVLAEIPGGVVSPPRWVDEDGQPCPTRPCPKCGRVIPVKRSIRPAPGSISGTPGAWQRGWSGLESFAHESTSRCLVLRRQTLSARRVLRG